MKLLILVAATFLHSACVTTLPAIKLTKAGEGVLAKLGEEPPIGYEEVGAVFGNHGGDCQRGEKEQAMNDIRNNAARIGATYVRIDNVLAPNTALECGEQHYIIRGVAFKPLVAREYD